MNEQLNNLEFQDEYTTNIEELDEHDNIASEDEVEVYKIKDEELATREGNYIFTIGNVSSGKSTLQALLLTRLWSLENITFKYGNSIQDHRHNAIIEGWINSIKKGILPKRSDQGYIQEFNIFIGQKGKKSVEVNFLEMSGEDIISIVPTLKEEQPKVHGHLDALLRSNNNINKRFIFISDGERHKRGSIIQGKISEDILFYNFLRYLFNEKELQSLNILFIISKWDTVKEDYKNNAMKYFKENFPQTKSIFDSNRVTSMLLPFTVGKIVEKPVDKKNNIYENRIVSLENIYVDRLIQWIYHTYTGETLKGLPPIKPSFLYKLAKMLGLR
jgi:hypothetical protein